MGLDPIALAQGVAVPAFIYLVGQTPAPFHVFN